jgi:hypothetical protein
MERQDLSCFLKDFLSKDFHKLNKNVIFEALGQRQGLGGPVRRETEARRESRAEQSRAEQSRAEQSRAEQSRAEQSTAEQSRTEQSSRGRGEGGNL